MPDSPPLPVGALRLASPAFAAATSDLRALVSSPAYAHELIATRLDHVCLVSGCESAGVYLFEEEAGQPRLRLSAQRGLDCSEQQSVATLARVQEVATKAATTGQLIVADDNESGFAAAALIAGEWSLGALVVVSAPPSPLDETRLAYLAPMARSLAGVIASQAISQQIREEQDRYERVAANVRDCIWTCYFDPFRITLLTDGIYSLSGYTRQEIIEQPSLMLEMIHPEDRHIPREQHEQIPAGKLQDIHYRVRVMHKDGQIRWLHTRGRAIHDEIGWRLDAISTDITDHIRLEEKVRRADRLSAVGMLAGGIAHEYNNLHFAILGTLDLLLMRNDLEEAVRGHINRVREAAERASDITNKLVAFARGGNGAHEVLDIAELIEATLGMVKREFSTRGIEVEIKQSSQTLQVEGNRAELGQVLINLVLNAQQAMEESAVKHLTISTGMRDGRIFISLSDTGQGIAPDHLSKLFDPFFTTKGAAGSWAHERSASEAHLPGRGLGLSVAQTIVEEHGGDIEVESEVGCGTRFTVNLPPLADPEAHMIEKQTETAVAKGRILIADDEAAVRDVCRELLEQIGYEVAAAEGGAEALQLLAEQPFNLVLVDLQMPDMPGLDLVREINKIPASQRPAKLIITGNIDDLPTETCTELGISGLLQKRASLSELISKVQLALATRQQ